MADLTDTRDEASPPRSATAPDDFPSGRDPALHQLVRHPGILEELEAQTGLDLAIPAGATSRLNVPPVVPQSTWPEAREITAAEGDSFPELLRSRRQRSGLTQAQLAQLSGLGLRTIGNWEQGRTLHPHRDSV